MPGLEFGYTTKTVIVIGGGIALPVGGVIYMLRRRPANPPAVIPAVNPDREP